MQLLNLSYQTCPRRLCSLLNLIANTLNIHCMIFDKLAWLDGFITKKHSWCVKDRLNK
jgi:hypothetical protein